MTNVIDFTAYRAKQAPKARPAMENCDNVVSLADWKATHMRAAHVTTDVLMGGGNAA